MADKIKRTFTLGDKVYTLEYSDFVDNIDVDDLLRIDYNNIIGEVLTFPLVLNRFGVLLADVEDALRKKTLEYELAVDTVKKEKAKAYGRAFAQFKLEGVNSPTGAQCDKKAEEDAVVLEKEAVALATRHQLIDIQKDRDTINALYWSAKSKDGKLDKLSEKVRSTDFEEELIDGLINGVKVKSAESLFKKGY